MFKKYIASTLCSFFLSFCIAAPASAETFTVNTIADTLDISPGDGECMDNNNACSLRAAIMEANAIPTFTRIHLPNASSSYILTRSDSSDSALIIRSPVSIMGDPYNKPVITVQSNSNKRVLEVAPNARLSLFNAVITNGNLTRFDGGAGNAGAGISVKQDAEFYGIGIEVTGCMVRNYNGAGMSNAGRAFLYKSHFAYNEVVDDLDNQQQFTGGAISNVGDLSIYQSSFTGNSATLGGAIFHSFSTTANSRLQMARVSMSGNRAASTGSAVYSVIPIYISQSTFVYNRITEDNGFNTGGALYLNSSSLLYNNIVARNTNVRADRARNLLVNDLHEYSGYNVFGELTPSTLSAISNTDTVLTEVEESEWTFSTMRLEKAQGELLNQQYPDQPVPVDYYPEYTSWYVLKPNDQNNKWQQRALDDCPNTFDYECLFYDTQDGSLMDLPPLEKKDAGAWQTRRVDYPNIPEQSYFASSAHGGPGTSSCTGSGHCTQESWGIDLNYNTGFRWDNVDGGSGGDATLAIQLSVLSGTRSMSLWVNNERVETLTVTSQQAPRPTGHIYGPYAVTLEPGMNTVELKDDQNSAEFDVHFIQIQNP